MLRSTSTVKQPWTKIEMQTPESSTAGSYDALDVYGLKLNIYRNYGESLVVSNVNQQWQFASIGDKKWLIINKKTGDYLSAKSNVPRLQNRSQTNLDIGDGGRTVPQLGDADYNTAHWRVTIADQGDPFRV